MRPGLVLTLLMVILCCAVSLSAQQRQPVLPPAAIPTAPAATPYDTPSQGAPGASIAVQRPPLSYTPMPAPVEMRQDETDFPRYPYPPFPNPYYDATMNRNVLNEGVDWLWTVSSQVAGRVSNFVDTGLFPSRPATHGGAIPPAPAGADQAPATGTLPAQSPVNPNQPGRGQ
jgi:hypothetical protein